MEKYADYQRCGEIYKSPSQSDKTPYILKCFRCSDVFLLLESFIFHIEDYCKQEDASTSTAVTTIKSEPVYAEQQFSIEMVEENYRGHDAEEFQEQKYTVHEIDEDAAVDNDGDCEIIEASTIEVKNEPLLDTDDVCVDAVDVYVSDVFESTDDQNEVDLSCDDDIEQFDFQDITDDTESADEDPVPEEGDVISGDSTPSPFILNFMESPTNVLTFITTYKNQPKLWNKKIYPYSEEQLQSCLESFTKELNDQLKLGMPSNIVLEMISYLQLTYKKDLKGIRKNDDGKKYKPVWYFQYLRFLKPFVESHIFANLDKSLPPIIPEHIIEIINIYKTFPHLWNCNFVEYCCQNKRSESELLMLRTIQFRMNLKLTQHVLQKYLRCIHSYFAREKYKQLENKTVVSDVPTTEAEPNYYSHLQFLNDHVGPFKCPDCDELVKSAFLIKTHISKHDGSTPLICSMCKKGFKTLKPYVFHARRHMEDFQEVCKKCGLKFLTASDLHSHIAFNCKPKRYNCETCGSSFSNIVAFTNHKTSHFTRPQFKCQVCNKSFRYKANLDKHMPLHGTSHGSHLCKTCGKVFTNPKALLVHETLHSELNKFECGKCGKVLKTKLNYDNHISLHGVKSSK